MLLEVANYKLIKVRCPLKAIEWNGEWADNSEKWNESAVKSAIRRLSEDDYAIFEDRDFSMWLSLAEAVSFFQTMSVCRVKDWHEVRLPGKFVRVYDSKDESYDAVLSKWFYHVEVNSNN